MFYAICSSLDFDGAGLGLVRYISFRAVAATLTAFVAALISGAWLIRRFERAAIGENVDKGPSAQLTELHRAKQGTPTMGGLFLIGSLLFASLLWGRFDGGSPFVAVTLCVALGFALVGFVDDWIKLKDRERGGLSTLTKQGWMTLIAVAAAVCLLAIHATDGPEDPAGPWLYVPFFQEPVVDLGLGLGIPFAIVSVLVLTGSANAVNLTDGLDGLAIGCVLCAAFAFAGICYFVGHSKLADYLLVEHVSGAGELTVVVGAMIGASFGFLWFNAAPARVFMGDVGSLPLGALLGFVALVTRTELMLFVVGGVFVVEALSVIVQVASFKMRGKRVLRCAPLHHHFQFGKVPETRIVVRTWVCAAVLALASLALFKVR